MPRGNAAAVTWCAVVGSEVTASVGVTAKDRHQVVAARGEVAALDTVGTVLA